MITFYPTIDVSTLAIEKLLCLPFWIVNNSEKLTGEKK
jgi:hypothetical protein